MFAFARGPAAMTICVGLVLGTAASAQEDRSGGHWVAAQQLIRAMFPELSGRHLQAQMSLTDDLDRDWARWAIGALSVHAHDPRAPSHSRRVLSGRFQFVQGRVREAHFDGEHVNSELAGRIASEVLKRGGWTSAEMRAAFAKAGARFVSQSGEQFLKQLAVEQWTMLLGRVVDAQARLVLEPPVRGNDTDTDFAPFWLVTIETVTQPDVRRRYDLAFELFNGRLTTLVELPR